MQETQAAGSAERLGRSQSRHLWPPACDTLLLIRDGIKAKVIAKPLCQRAGHNTVRWVTENSPAVETLKAHRTWSEKAGDELAAQQ